MRLKDGGYGLRDNTLFHLYVSTSPCGDARLHSPYEITKDRKPRRFYLFHQPMFSGVGASVPGCLCPDPACAVWPSPETLDTGGVCHPVVSLRAGSQEKSDVKSEVSSVIAWVPTPSQSVRNFLSNWRTG